MSSHHEPICSSVLHVSITHLIYPVTEKVLGQIFDVYGVNEVCLLQQPTHLDVYVEFQSWHEASQARGALHCRCIYYGCCLLEIQHASPSISVHRLPNSEAVVVDWDEVEAASLASAQPPSSSTSARAAARTTCMAICKVSTEVHSDAACPIVGKALDSEEVVALRVAPHGTSSAAATKVNEAREDVFPAVTGYIDMAPTSCSIECLNQARWTSSGEGFRLPLVCLSTLPPWATDLVFCESQGGVFVPSRPLKPPDPAQGSSLHNLILDYTNDKLMLVQLETVEWDPGIIQWSFLDNLKLVWRHEHAVEYETVIHFNLPLWSTNAFRYGNSATHGAHLLHGSTQIWRKNAFSASKIGTGQVQHGFQNVPPWRRNAFSPGYKEQRQTVWMLCDARQWTDIHDSTETCTQVAPSNIQFFLPMLCVYWYCTVVETTWSDKSVMAIHLYVQWDPGIKSILLLLGPPLMVSTKGLIQFVQRSWTPHVLLHAVILDNPQMLHIYFLHTTWCSIGVDISLNEHRGALAYLLPWRGTTLQLVMEVMHVENEYLHQIAYLEVGYNSCSVKAGDFQHRHVLETDSMDYVFGDALLNVKRDSQLLERYSETATPCGYKFCNEHTTP